MPTLQKRLQDITRDLKKYTHEAEENGPAEEQPADQAAQRSLPRFSDHSGSSATGRFSAAMALKLPKTGMGFSSLGEVGSVSVFRGARIPFLWNRQSSSRSSMVKGSVKGSASGTPSVNPIQLYSSILSTNDIHDKLLTSTDPVHTPAGSQWISEGCLEYASVAEKNHVPTIITPCCNMFSPQVHCDLLTFSEGLPAPSLPPF